MIREFLFSAYRRGVSRFRETSIGRLNPVPIADRYLFPFLKPESAVVDGHRLLLDEKDSLRLSLYPYEPRVASVVKQEVRPGQTVLDVGANLGYYTLLFARAVGVSGRLYALEPVEDNEHQME